MMAWVTGWPTETDEAGQLWDKMHDDPGWVEFAEAWMDEVKYAKENRQAFSEPFGQLLEFVGGTNLHRDQYFTPMTVVRAMSEMMFHDHPSSGTEYLHGLDLCCGTGRMMLDALVFNDRLIMGNIDVDLWLQRVAKINARLLDQWTTLHEPTPLWSAARAGRARFIHGDALMVDLSYHHNWNQGWYWTPAPWQQTLKIRGYYGSLSEWEADGCPKESKDSGEVQFDYSMAPP